MDLPLLIEVARAVGAHGQRRIPTATLAERLGRSQQSVSRQLRSLDELGVISRSSSTRGVMLYLTDEGRSVLRRQLEALSSIFEPARSLRGKLVTGIGEGAYYMGLEQYKKQFRRRLGFSPYAGTLNLEVDPALVDGFLAGRKRFPIAGFTVRQRSFGPLDAYPVQIDDLSVGLVVPERTSHPRRIVEVIAPMRLRAALGLRDGDEVVLR